MSLRSSARQTRHAGLNVGHGKALLGGSNEGQEFKGQRFVHGAIMARYLQKWRNHLA
jgi:hypothetical protein